MLITLQSTTIAQSTIVEEISSDTPEFHREYFARQVRSYIQTKPVSEVESMLNRIEQYLTTANQQTQDNYWLFADVAATIDATLQWAVGGQTISDYIVWRDSIDLAQLLAATDLLEWRGEQFTIFNPLPAYTASVLKRIAADESLLNAEEVMRDVVLYNVLPTALPWSILSVYPAQTRLQTLQGETVTLMGWNPIFVIENAYTVWPDSVNVDGTLSVHLMNSLMIPPSLRSVVPYVFSTVQPPVPVNTSNSWVAAPVTTPPAVIQQSTRRGARTPEEIAKNPNNLPELDGYVSPTPPKSQQEEIEAFLKINPTNTPTI